MLEKPRSSEQEAPNREKYPPGQSKNRKKSKAAKQQNKKNLYGPLLPLPQSSTLPCNLC